MPKIAYKRVSSVEQNISRQLDGLTFDKEFIDYCSGKDTKRPELQKMMDYIREGDEVYVHSIDRLARNTSDMLELVKQFNNLGVSINFIKENMNFSANKENPTQELILTIITAIAQFERNIISERSREGIAIAKAQGKYKGGKVRVLTPEVIEKIKAMKKDRYRPSEIQQELKISRTSYYLALK